LEFHALRGLASTLLVFFSALLLGCPSATPPGAQGVVIYGFDSGPSGIDGTSAITGQVVVVLGGISSDAGLSFYVQTPPQHYPALTFLAELPGTTLDAGTYDETNTLSAASTVQEAATGGVVWVQDFNSQLAVGTFTLVLYSVGPPSPIDGGTAWLLPQGYLWVTLVPLGNVTDAGITLCVLMGALCPQ
jgi:hypothetical protein